MLRAGRMSRVDRSWRSLFFGILTAGLAIGCGRVSYRPYDSGMDALVAREDADLTDAPSPLDAPADAPVSPDAWESLDAPLEADAAIDPTCAAVYADHTSFDDATVFDCAVRAQLGACYVSDTRSCGSCACDYYVKNQRTRCTGVCDVRLEETGCADFGTSDPPWGCSGDVVTLSVCILRQELDAGECAPCAC